MSERLFKVNLAVHVFADDDDNALMRAREAICEGVLDEEQLEVGTVEEVREPKLLKATPVAFNVEHHGFGYVPKFETEF